MGAYKNDYKKNEDEMLWELHEIRHKIHQELKKKSLKKFNKEAREEFERWKKGSEDKKIKLAG